MRALCAYYCAHAKTLHASHDVTWASCLPLSDNPVASTPKIKRSTHFHVILFPNSCSLYFVLEAQFLAEHSAAETTLLRSIAMRQDNISSTKHIRSRVNCSFQEVPCKLLLRPARSGVGTSKPRAGNPCDSRASTHHRPPSMSGFSSYCSRLDWVAAIFPVSPIVRCCSASWCVSFLTD